MKSNSTLAAILVLFVSVGIIGYVLFYALINPSTNKYKQKNWSITCRSGGQIYYERKGLDYTEWIINGSYLQVAPDNVWLIGDCILLKEENNF